MERKFLDNKCIISGETYITVNIAVYFTLCSNVILACAACAVLLRIQTSLHYHYYVCHIHTAINVCIAPEVILIGRRLCWI